MEGQQLERQQPTAYPQVGRATQRAPDPVGQDDPVEHVGEVGEGPVGSSYDDRVALRHLADERGVDRTRDLSVHATGQRREVEVPVLAERVEDCGVEAEHLAQGRDDFHGADLRVGGGSSVSGIGAVCWRPPQAPVGPAC